jgi:hypothetical protein
MVSFILPGNSASGVYEVANSLRFDDGSSDYLARTNASATNNTKYTYSVWVKRATLGTNQSILYNWYDGSNHAYIFFATDDKLALYDQLSGTDNINMKTSAVFRDVSAWYNIVVKVDTTESTQADRVRVFINGVEDPIGTRSTQPGSSASLGMKTNSLTNYMAISSFVNSSGNYLDAYMSEVVYIDGQALDPTSFGEFDEDTNIWKPIDVSGLTFGTNGFYLDFEDSSSLGNDAAGSNNFSVSNLTSVDQSTDTCTNNFATMNPLSAGVGDTNRIPTFAEGNLKFTASSSTFCQAISTFGVDQGKWYYEVKVVSSTHLDKLRVGLWNIDKNVSSGEIQDVSSANSGVFYMNKDGGEMRLNATSTTNDYGTFAQNDIIGVANDIDNRTISIYKNGSVIVNAYDYSGGIASGTVLTPAFMGHTNTSFEINFGSPSFSISSGNSDGNGYGNFEYSVPSGYYSLNSKNLAEYG